MAYFHLTRVSLKSLNVYDIAHDSLHLGVSKAINQVEFFATFLRLDIIVRFGSFLHKIRILGDSISGRERYPFSVLCSLEEINFIRYYL